MLRTDLLSELRVELLFEFFPSDERYDAAHEARQWQHDAVPAGLDVGIVELLPLLLRSRQLVTVPTVVLLLLLPRFSEQMSVRGSVTRRLQRSGQIR